MKGNRPGLAISPPTTNSEKFNMTKHGKLYQIVINIGTGSINLLLLSKLMPHSPLSSAGIHVPEDELVDDDIIVAVVAAVGVVLVVLIGLWGLVVGSGFVKVGKFCVCVFGGLEFEFGLKPVSSSHLWSQWPQLGFLRSMMCLLACAKGEYTVIWQLSFN